MALCECDGCRMLRGGRQGLAERLKGDRRLVGVATGDDGGEGEVGERRGKLLKGEVRLEWSAAGV